MRPVAVVASAATLALAAGAGAEVRFYQAIINGANERPVPIETPSTGVGNFVLDTTAGTLSWTISWTPLTGNPTVAHIHRSSNPADPFNSTGGIIFDLVMLSGQSDNSFTSPFIGSTPITPAQIADLDAQLYYVNIHSTFSPPGEIRGQIILIPAPGAAALLGLGGMVAMRRRRA